MTNTSPVRLEDTAAIVLRAMLRDPERAVVLADDVDGWLSAHADEVGAHTVPWCAAKAVEVSLAALSEGNDAGVDPEWVARLEAAPVAGRVAVVLHRFVGLGVEETASICLRPVESVAALVAPFDDLAVPVVPSPSAATVAAAVSPPPPPPPDPAPPMAAPVAVPAVASAPPPPAAPVAVLPPPAAPVAELLGEPALLGAGRSRRRHWATAVAGLTVAALAIGSAVALSDGPPPRSATTIAPAVGPSTQVVNRGDSKGCTGPDAGIVSEGAVITQQIGGIDRSYRLYAPSSPTPDQPRGLVVAFADVSEPVPVFVEESGLDPMARELGLVVVHMMPVTAPTAWNVLGAPDEPSDIDAAAMVVEQLMDRVCVDERRVVLVGKGVGGHLALAVACARPTLVTAAIVVAGAYLPDTCASFSGTTVAMTVGGADDVFPPSGGTGPGYNLVVPDPAALPVGGQYDPPPFDATVAAWSTELGCVTSTSETLPDATISRYGDCYDENSVIAAVSPAAGHQWTAAATYLIREQLRSG